MKNRAVALLVAFMLFLGTVSVTTAPSAVAAGNPDTRYVKCGSNIDKTRGITMTKYLRVEVDIYVQLCIEKKPKKKEQYWSRVTGVMYGYSYSRPGPSCGPPGGLNKMTFRAYMSDSSGRNFNQPAVTMKCWEGPAATYRDYRKAGIFLKAFHHPKARVNVFADFAKPSKDVSDSLFMRLEPWKG